MVVALIPVLAIAWLITLIVTPVFPTWLSAAIYLIGSTICHQRAERSFHLFGAQLPVCARCLGIYAGAAAAAAVWRWMSLTLRRWSPREVLVVGAMPTAVTLCAEWAGLWAGANVGRAAAGLVLGFAVGVVVMQAAATLHYVECVPRRPIANSRRTIRT